LQQQIQQVQQQATLIQQATPKTELAPADLRTATLAFQQLQQRSSAPAKFLTPLSMVLNRYPKVVLDELAWQMKADEAVAANTQGDVAAQVLQFKGHLESFADNYRDALTYLEQFQAALNAQGYVTSITEKPLDVSPSSNLSDQNNSAKSSLSFILNLVWRPRL